MRIEPTMTIDPKIPTVKNNLKEDKELRKTCQEFESIFMGQMLKAMRQTVTKSNLFGSDKHEEYFQDMIDNQICDQAAKSESMGIADMLYRQLTASEVKKND